MEVSGDALQAALARAITDAITPEAQKQIFEKAMLEYLFHKDSRSATTPLTDAFKKALNDATATVAQQIVNEPENRAKIATAFQEAFDQVQPTLVAALVKKLTPRYGW